MSSNDIDRSLRDRLRDAIDPKVPGPEVADRLMSAVARVASEDRLRSTGGSRIGRGLGTILVASLVVLLVGGALGISLALRSRTLPTAPSSHGKAPLTLPTPSIPRRRFHRCRLRHPHPWPGSPPAGAVISRPTSPTRMALPAP